MFNLVESLISPGEDPERARPPLIAIRVAKMYAKTFLDAIAMVSRRVYATLILIGQSNLDRPIRADETEHRNKLIS